MKTEQYYELCVEKMKLDKFFSMFLDKFGDKLDSDKPNTPEWKLYHKKYDEYMKVDSKIKSLKYFMSEKNV